MRRTSHWAYRLCSHTVLDWVDFPNLLQTIDIHSPLASNVVKGGSSKVHVAIRFYDTNLGTNILSMGWVIIPWSVQCNMSERCRVGRSFLSYNVMRVIHYVHHLALRLGSLAPDVFKICDNNTFPIHLHRIQKTSSERKQVVRPCNACDIKKVIRTKRNQDFFI